MYPYVLLLHSAVRWLVLGSLLFAICRFAVGYRRQAPFTPTDNAIRHWTATIAHLQLLVGFAVYGTSPQIRFFWSAVRAAIQYREPAFFALVHSLLMLAAIVLITIGSALAKRRSPARNQFRTLLTWFSVALLLILLAIPWPFSPFAHRPYIRFH